MDPDLDILWQAWDSIIIKREQDVNETESHCVFSPETKSRPSLTFPTTNSMNISRTNIHLYSYRLKLNLSITSNYPVQINNKQ